MNLYMAVTADEYELPIDFAYTAEELAERFGIKKTTILSELSRRSSGRNRGYKFIKVEGIEEAMTFYEYYVQWVRTYKEGAVRKVTLNKYKLTISWLGKIAPDLEIKDLTRIKYQEIINAYAETHEKQTVMDFHHQLKGAILDAVDEGLIERDPTRKVVIKGKAPREKKIKYLNQYDVHKLIEDLDLGKEPSFDWLIFLLIKTGLRFSEALALTPGDFDFQNQTLSVSKTWNYKEGGGFMPTKNKSSIRNIRIDWKTITLFSALIEGLKEDEPIFVEKDKAIYNSTANDILVRHCRRLGLNEISIHGLRHTHASLLLYAGASVASVSRRLGHSSINTTQKVYLHIIQELENQDVDLMMRSMSGL